MVSEFQGEFRFLSNFWPVWVDFDGVLYPSVEHAYQAAKTLDKQKRLEMSKLTAGQAKRAGQKLVLRPDWEEVKIPIMKELLQKKFSYRELRFKLARIEGEIIEGNTWGDTFWGICNGQGQNILGRLLMDIRDS
jgi:ribA/ribD-fused uncharacterized protein